VPRSTVISPASPQALSSSSLLIVAAAAAAAAADAAPSPLFEPKLNFRLSYLRPHTCVLCVLRVFCGERRRFVSFGLGLVCLAHSLGNLKSFLCENFENSCALLSFAIVPLTGSAAAAAATAAAAAIAAATSVRATYRNNTTLVSDEYIRLDIRFARSPRQVQTANRVRSKGSRAPERHSFVPVRASGHELHPGSNIAARQQHHAEQAALELWSWSGAPECVTLHSDH